MSQGKQTVNLNKAQRLLNKKLEQKMEMKHGLTELVCVSE